MAVLVFTLFFYCLRLLLNALWPGGPGHSNANAAGGGGGPSSAQWEALLRELQTLRAEVQGAYHTVILGLGFIPLRGVWLTDVVLRTHTHISSQSCAATCRR